MRHGISVYWLSTKLAQRVQKGKRQNILGKQRIGFDIGESSVKMVLVSGTEIKNAVTADLPDHMVENGSILSMDAMADFIRTQAKAHHLPKAEAAVILPASTIFVRTITVPVMTEQQLLFNLPFEFKDYLTEEKRNYLFDYAVLEVLPDEAGQPHELRLLACAVHKEVIEAYRSMFKRAGFKLKLAVPQECAYTNLIRRLDPAIGQDCCIADIGHSGTRLHLFHQREYATVRNVDIGMRALDEIIAAVQEVDVHMAHTYKESNYNQVLESDDAQRLYSSLAVEMAKAVNFFNYNNRNAQLEDIYLCGGGACIAPLTRAIEEATHMQVHSAAALMPPLQQPEDAYHFLQGYGLAIGEK